MFFARLTVLKWDTNKLFSLFIPLLKKFLVQSFVVVVVWQGICDPGQTQEKNGDRGFILLPPQPAVLPKSDAGSNGVEPAFYFVIQNCQTHYSSRCPMYGTY